MCARKTKRGRLGHSQSVQCHLARRTNVLLPRLESAIKAASWALVLGSIAPISAVDEQGTVGVDDLGRDDANNNDKQTQLLRACGALASAVLVAGDRASVNMTMFYHQCFEDSLVFGALTDI